MSKGSDPAITRMLTAVTAGDPDAVDVNEVERQWRFIRTWLQRELENADAD